MELLERLISLFSGYGYVAVFTALLLCGFGVPLPEDITLVAGGVIAGLGYADVRVMMAITMAGVLIGDGCMFMLGHRFGDRVRQWPLVARMLTPERHAKVQQKFERYGNRLLFFARFLPGLRAVIYLTAGSTRRVSFARFVLLDGLAALISVPLWVYLGYIGANNRQWLAKWISHGQHGVWLIIGVLILVMLLLWWRRRARRRTRD